MPDKYGLSEEDFQALLSAQDGRCAGCGRRFTSRRPPHRDHDHRTGNVRGLLDNRCNRLLGYVHDDSALLYDLASYLNDPPANEVFDQPRRSPDAPPLEYLT